MARIKYPPAIFALSGSNISNVKVTGGQFGTFDHTNGVRITDCSNFDSDICITAEGATDLQVNGFYADSEGATKNWRDRVSTSSASTKYFSGWTPPKQHEDKMNTTKSVIRLVDSPDHKINNVYAVGFDHVVDVLRSGGGSYDNIIAQAPGEPQIDPEILKAFFLAIRSEKAQNSDDVRRAAEKSGLWEWLSAHGIEAATFISDHSDKLLAIDWSNISLPF